MIKYKLLFLILVFCSYSAIYAQKGSAVIFGKITDVNGEPLPGINVFIKNRGIGAATNSEGTYKISNVPSGKNIINVSGIGFLTITKEILISEGDSLNLNFEMTEKAVELGSVLVEGKSEAQLLRERGFSVAVLESREKKNLPVDGNRLLSSAPGIHLRESGGLGSGFNLSMNGLSGNQIRYFIDGIPLENFGSALTLNNFPVNLIEKIEIYKGVVPISLGADALGGAVNIVTGYWKTSYLDASYSLGSFNTHRFSLNGQYADNTRKYFLKASIFWNYSDNDFIMKNAPVYDLELGNFIKNIDIRRFHDSYSSMMINAETGLFERKYADKISLRIILAGNNKDYQHPDNNIYRVFGRFHTTNRTAIAGVTYSNQFDNMELKAYSAAGIVSESVVDTSHFKFNWAGESIKRDESDPKGELFERKSLFEFSDFIISNNIGTIYKFSHSHSLGINIVQNYVVRKGKDKVDEFNRSFESPNYINKILSGADYTFKYNDRFEFNLFAKSYLYRAKIITIDYDDTEIITEPELFRSGYGFALSYSPLEKLLIKNSFEKAYRIPESYEILGDGIYVLPNPNLSPERSYNLNLGIDYRFESGLWEVKAGVNYFYRLSKDFIRFNPLGPFGEYENLRNVKADGIEGAFSFSYDDFVSLNSNITYQNLLDDTEFDEGLPNTNYKSRIPNVPYFFFNNSLGISLNRKSSPRKINLYYSLRYVHQFFLTWENLGDARGKNVIPSQLIQDIHVEFSMNEGRYNITFSIANIFDKLAYDNFMIQKPGRAFNIKLRYFYK
ncbi:MAG: TonB-dependent receptor [Melioribacter sp.]|uniref:TonB-dependent receptor n=1 Tax=Melioribacter sp. TaxID=2052167 RepID=UPI003BC9C5BF